MSVPERMPCRLRASPADQPIGGMYAVLEGQDKPIIVSALNDQVAERTTVGDHHLRHNHQG